jgi:glyoxylase I family protein
MPAIAGSQHIALTVRDADASAAWYSDLLGMQVVLFNDDDDVRSRVLVDPSSGFGVALRQYRDGTSDRFDEFRTGLDHLAFAVSSRADLEAWERELSARGIPYSPIADTPMGSLVVFRDPDGIQLEFWLPLTEHG